MFSINFAIIYSDLLNVICYSGKGDVIGLLKVGHKHLFLFDEKDKVREVEPLCVLDFFVLPDRQRHGYGRVLFDHMLHVSFKSKKICFTLYPAHSRVGRGNLVLRHSVLHFLTNSGGIAW